MADGTISGLLALLLVSDDAGLENPCARLQSDVRGGATEPSQTVFGFGRYAARNRNR